VRARLATDCRKSNGDRTFLALCAEHVGHAKIIERVRAFEDTMSTAALGVDDTLRDALAVEVGEEVDQVEVLKQKRAILAGSLRLVRMGLRGSIAASS
jgi:hypothetical protein